MTLGKMLKIIKWILAVALISISVFGSFGSRDLEVRQNSLLNNPHGIVVDKEGVIYCGINYSKINAYDKNGLFLRTFSVDSNGGDFKMELMANRLLVSTVRNKMIYEYDLNGKLIKQEKRQDNDTGFQQLSENQFEDSTGTIYRMKSPFLLYPYIEKTNSAGEKTKLLSVPITKWIFMSPYPSWHFGFIGLLLIAIDLNVIKKYLRPNSSKA